MKKYLSGSFFLVWMMTTVSAVNAAPERISIKSPEKATEEKMAVAQLKTVDLQDIEDPAAKKAIEQILNYLGLKSQSAGISK